MIERLAGIDSGLILITGCCGSGKTSLMYVLAKALAEKGLIIKSIEDPIECNIVGVSQVAINKKSVIQEEWTTYEKEINKALRQDVDIIMLGELRDRNLVLKAIEAAKTGHLVISTMHSKSVEDTINRLKNDMKIDTVDLDVLKGIISQRLVPNNYGSVNKLYNRSVVSEISHIGEDYYTFNENAKELLKKGIINQETYAKFIY